MPRLISAFVVILVFCAPARAYLDAGSGSLLLQTLLAGLGGLAVFLRLRWNRIFRRKDKTKEPGP